MKHLMLATALLLPTLAFADPPKIKSAGAQPGGKSYSFSVTIRHPDTGWDHYADAWEVLTRDGTRLAIRELQHPHENEQPFTRSLGGVRVPAGITQVLIRARCSVDGWSQETVVVELGR